MSDEYRDLSKLSDEELKQQFFALSAEQSKRFEQEIDQAWAGIEALLEEYPWLTKTRILRITLRRMQADQVMNVLRTEYPQLSEVEIVRMTLRKMREMRAEDESIQNEQINVGDISVTGHIHIVENNGAEEDRDVE